MSELRTASTSAGLVDRVRRGDTSAETELFERFAARIHIVARRELRSSSAADDVRSETMLRVIRNLRDGRLREPEALPGFVLQTARNVIREQARQDRRVVALDTSDVAHEPSAFVEPADPLAAAALRQAVASLAARDRAFLRLHYYQELSREEVARRLGISEDRVRLVKSRALDRFRRAYQSLTRADTPEA